MLESGSRQLSKPTLMHTGGNRASVLRMRKDQLESQIQTLSSSKTQIITAASGLEASLKATRNTATKLSAEIQKLQAKHVQCLQLLGQLDSGVSLANLDDRRLAITTQMQNLNVGCFFGKARPRRWERGGNLSLKMAILDPHEQYTTQTHTNNTLNKCNATESSNPIRSAIHGAVDSKPEGEVQIADWRLLPRH